MLADPALALIAQKRAADLAHIDAINVQDEIEGREGRWTAASIEAQDNCGDACDLVNQLDWKLAKTPPTTLAGIAAALRLANEIEDEGGDWPDTDAIGPEGWHYQLRATMAAAVETLIKTGQFT